MKTEGTESLDSSARARGTHIGSMALGAAVLLAISIYGLHWDIRSYSLLEHFLNPQASGILLHLESHPVQTQDITISLTRGGVRTRLYMPIGLAHPPGMVIVHGMHHLGIDEPRLMSFARAMASSGFAVLTPEVAALTDYHVDEDSVATIGESPQWLQHTLNSSPVTLVGISFGGGLSLLAACNPRYAEHIRVLLVMGAYDNLARVSRFLATGQAELPDGRREPYIAHNYGTSVYVYSHLAQFFDARDIATAHDALREWLWEHPQRAQQLIAQLDGADRATMNILLTREIGQLRPKLLAAIQQDQPQLSALSPERRIGTLRVPIFILHGSTDDIIPSTESLWLEQEIPRAYMKDALITPAFSHVDPHKTSDWRDEWRLVGFLGDFLRAAYY